MKKASSTKPEELIEIGSRVKVARVSLGLTQTEFGKAFDLRQTSIAQIENGYNAPNMQILKWFCNEGIDLNWLISGESMETNSAFDLTDWQIKEKVLIKLLKNLDEEELNAIEQMVRVLIRHKKDKET